MTLTTPMTAQRSHSGSPRGPVRRCDVLMRFSVRGGPRRGSGSPRRPPGRPAPRRLTPRRVLAGPWRGAGPSSRSSGGAGRARRGRAGTAGVSSGSGRDSVTKPSACMIAKPILGRSRELGKTRKRGTHSGWNFALNLYSDSIWNQRDRNTSSPRQPRSTGPAPIRSPRASAERNIAKFSDTRETPSAGACLEGGDDQQLVEPGVGGRGRGASAPATCRPRPRARSAGRRAGRRVRGAGRRARAPCGR